MSKEMNDLEFDAVFDVLYDRLAALPDTPCVRAAFGGVHHLMRDLEQRRITRNQFLTEVSDTVERAERRTRDISKSESYDTGGISELDD